MHSLLFLTRRPAALARIAGTMSAAVVLVPTLAAPTAAGRADVASASTCATSRLVIWLDTQGNGAAGSITYNLQFTNLSGHRCTLFGYPGVSAVGLTGAQLGSAASRDSARRARTVTIANGGTASAQLRIVDAGNFPASSCRPRMAAGLRVFPPNQAASKVVPFPFMACSRSGPTYLFIRVVR